MRFHTRIGAFVLALVATVASAQDPLELAPSEPAEPEPPARQYKVEVLIFGYADFDPTEERLEHGTVRALPPADVVRREPRRYDDTNLESVLEAEPEALPGEEPLVGETQTSPSGLRFRLLRPEELELTDRYRTLQRIPAYRPLAHAGWVQQALPENEARPLDLAFVGVPNPSGSIRLHLSRFLHLKLDLRYQHGARSRATDTGLRELDELDLTPRFSLVAERPMRSRQLHYFDHPAFGLLVMITPLPPDAAPLLPRGTEPAA